MGQRGGRWSRVLALGMAFGAGTVVGYGIVGVRSSAPPLVPVALAAVTKQLPIDAGLPCPRTECLEWTARGCRWMLTVPCVDEALAEAPLPSTR